MNVRARSLPYGWYPRTGDEVSREIEAWEGGGAPARASLAIVAPHAGWAYSGRLAWTGFRSGVEDVETVAIVGGHLPAGVPALYAAEDAFESPFGTVEADVELRKAVLSRLEALGIAFSPDRHADNTVEVLVPFARARYPKARLLWLRASADLDAIGVGEAVALAAADAGRKILFVASTDLTHYGPAYGFEPAGRGPGAVAWAARNDREFADAALAFGAAEALRKAVEDGAACSPGAVCAAIGYAGRAVAPRSALLALGSSLDVAAAESFVGYASIAYAAE